MNPKKTFKTLLCGCAALAGMICVHTSAFAINNTDSLAVIVSDVDNNSPMPDKYAYCMSDERGRTKDAENISPSISWTRGPAGTQSYAVIMVDSDMPDNNNAPPPGQIDPVSQPIPADAPRHNFYHWVMIDIPAKIKRLAGHNNGKYGTIGQNSYAGHGKGLDGYDGPCPPWNDQRLHHYHFEVFALDVPKLNLQPNFTGPQVEAAMNGHILAKGEVVGTYTTNSSLNDNIKPM